MRAAVQSGTNRYAQLLVNIMEKPKLLIIEDDESIRSQMRWALNQDYDVFLAQDRNGALEIISKEKPSIITLDLGLPPYPEDTREGFAVLSEILSRDSFAKIVVITGRGERDHALRAIGQGAYDFFSKPIQIEELNIVLRRAGYVSQIERDYHELQQRYASNQIFEGMFGTSSEIQKVFTSIRKVATSDIPVLIVGESGTGKELVAKAIHRLSSRKDKPFIVINCGAIPETLLESELFGHEKGAFTGAHIQRKGRIEIAQGGMLFLDEVGELPLALQVKILRFLQEQKIERIGGREEIPVDVRVLAATNKDLKQELKGARFREDLYYRLSVVTISLPPLRERKGDVLFLAKTFLEKYSRENAKRNLTFTPQALQILERHPWEGNVRELENRIKRSVVMADGTKITPADLELDSPFEGVKGKSLKEAREEMEKHLVMEGLNRHRGNISKLAEELEISRPTLYEMMEKLGIKKDRG